MGNLMKKLVGPVVAGAITLASLAGCIQPGGSNPSNPNPPSGTKPGTPSFYLVPEAIEPNRIMQLIIQDYNFDENSITIQKNVGGVYTTLSTMTLDSYGEGVYNDRGLSTSTAYTYRIKANNSAGSSDWVQQSATSPGPQSGTKTVYDSEDTWVAQALPNTNNKSAYGDRLIISSGGMGPEYSYVKFPYGNLSSYATITSAQLRLVTWNEQTGPTDSVCVENINPTTQNYNGSWSQYSLTYNTQPNWQGYQSQSVNLPSLKDQVLYVDITPMLRDYGGTESGNNGIVLLPGALGSGVRGFYSNTNSSKMPSVTINYTW